MWQERDDWERESFYWIYYVDGNWYNYYVSNIITIHRTQFNVFFSYECFLDARCISLLYVWNKFIIPNNQTWTKQKVYLPSLLWTAAEKCSTKETATEKKKWFFSSKIPFTLKIRTLILFPYFAFAFLFTHHCMLCFVTGKRRKGKKNPPTMKSTIMWVVFGTTFLLAGTSVNGWGGIYTNRFSPEMLQNMGYGGQHRLFQAEVSHHFLFFHIHTKLLLLLLCTTKMLFISR